MSDKTRRVTSVQEKSFPPTFIISQKGKGKKKKKPGERKALDLCLLAIYSKKL